ncbi:MAG TPA: HAMP domain-containing methyl-accepting chemotaxis protein [Thermoanaerobaculia bacterium]|nr:HAMP domain-containing methyl-accepting chemotaxis protein [Thermoanaerobaculia bacterium]
MLSPTRSRFGLRSKFILAFALQTIVVAVLIVAIEQYRVRRVIVQQTIEQGKAVATTIESTAGYYVLFGLNDDLKKIVDDLKRNRSVDYADFTTADGKPLAASSETIPAPVASQKLGHNRVFDEARRMFIVPFFESKADADNPAAKPKGYFRLLVNERSAESALAELQLWNIGITLFALLLAVVLAMLGSRFIIRPILQLAETATQIAQGDLTQRARVDSTDEIGGLSEAFNSMASNLERTIKSLVLSQQKLKSVGDTVGARSRTVIDRVDEQRSIIDETYQSVDKLNVGVRKITDNVEALSASSEETSSSMLEMVASMEEVSRHTDTLFSSVEETASATHEMVSSINEVDQNVVYLTNFVTDTSSSMVEMSASIAQVEANAAQSYDLALAVADAAESGMKAVRETIEGMEQIRQSVVEANAVVSRLGERSAAVGKILNVIEDVAEQTNLLALNAAILAAQAGEYGKGFSVVATEIRDLSERTASSTRDIANLIGNVQSEVGNALQAMTAGSRLVEDGVSLSHEAGKALNKILDSTAKASGMGKEIAAATREQAKGSEAVTRAVERLQEMVKQINSATTQQAQGSDHILKAVEQMREVTKYVRQAMVEQKSGSSMISNAAERMIDMIHEIFQVAANQASESEKIVATMQQVRAIADSNRTEAGDVGESLTLLSDAIRSLDEEIRKFRVRA